MFSTSSLSPSAVQGRRGWAIGWLLTAVSTALVVVGVAAPGWSDSTDFVTTWKTDNTSPGSSAANEVRLPLEATGTYNFAVDWDGDAVSDETITAWDKATHTYAEPGTYTITISFPEKDSILTGWRFGNAGDCLKILDVHQWGGVVNLGNAGGYFAGAANLTSSATDSPDLDGTTSLNTAFAGATQFDGPIGEWNTSAVTTMTAMFSAATAFNQPLGHWDTANVTNMASMFSGAGAFNQDISTWNTANVTSMAFMFDGASAFNQPLNAWDTSKVTSMTAMFSRASAFNQDIGTWNTGDVTAMKGMFSWAPAFNQPLNAWDTSRVTDMSDMFNSATAFNQDIGAWNVSNVTDMSGMFTMATGFNQEIGGWDVSGVTDMNGMFWWALAFDQPLGAWDTGQVIDMSGTFARARAFNHPLGDWDLSGVATMDAMLDYSGLATSTYDATLNGWWEQASLPNGVTLGAAGLRYSCAAKVSHDQLVADHGWFITDAGLGACVSLSPTPIAFEGTPLQQASERNVTVSNPGGADLRVPLAGVGLSGPDAGQFGISSDGCSSATVPPGGACIVTVRFTPTSTGVKTADLSLVSNATSSPDNAAVSGTGIPTVPGPPTGVTASVFDGYVILAWKPPADDGGSPVLDYRATSSPDGASCTTTATTCTVVGLTPGASYTFTVTARNAVGLSAPSIPSAAITPVVAPPGKVTGVTARVHRRILTVRWTATPGATSYRVRISKPNRHSYRAWRTTTGQRFTAKIRKATTYRVQVTAIGPGGRGPVTTIRFSPKRPQKTYPASEGPTGAILAARHP